MAENATYESSESGDDNWDGWDDEETPAVSLYSRHPCENIDLALSEDKKLGFDFIKTCAQLRLDMYGCIRLVNYLRSLDSIDHSTLSAFSSNPSVLQNDKLLLPVVDNDPYLQLDFEQLIEEFNDDLGPSQDASTSAGRTADSIGQNHHMKHLEQELRKQSQIITDLQNIIRTQLGVDRLDADDTDNGGQSSKQKARDDDTHYFSSYSYSDIHHLMLSDKVRTDAYRDYILGSHSTFADALVLDVGCGSGILSMFAARAGAKHVYAVDASSIATRAASNVRDNGLQDTITVIQGKIEDITLPVNKVDIIVSEWMGYFLLYESMLDSVLFSRDRYLSANGTMAPSNCTIMLTAISDQKLIDEYTNFWDDVYGYKMPAMREDAYTDSIVSQVRPESTICHPVSIKEFDMTTCTPSSVDFKSQFELTVNISSSETLPLHALVGYFDTTFSTSTNNNNNTPMKFSTSPHDPLTHWKQTIFLLDKKNYSNTNSKNDLMTVTQGDRIKGEFHCLKSDLNSRELVVNVVLNIVDTNGEHKLSESFVQMWNVK